ncbi:amidohydrolase family protein [Thalassotalea crassostreae]|uniref:amidohydrolase family protein n=1 Tax=Thalassotalea crassostreae TaxID=1763536 RepID=UPI0008392635|nr:amidohydrolase family protein [Thalassotalea crassostreae]
MKIIDPHLHLFALEHGQYQWLKPENPPHWPDKKQINRSFDERDLMLNSNNELHGFVHIEAGFDNQSPTAEIEFLEQNVETNFKSIAFADITASTTYFKNQINALKQYSSVIGIRYILEQQALKILSQENIQLNLTYLAEQELIFEAQLPIDDKAAVDELVSILKKNPTLKIVITHAGFGNISNIEDWLVGLHALAQSKQCCIKCSGWEMNDRNWNWQDIETLLKQMLDAFGEDRVMLASNFPVSTLTITYQQLWQGYAELELFRTRSKLLSKLCFTNAKNCYQIQGL